MKRLLAFRRLAIFALMSIPLGSSGQLALGQTGDATQTKPTEIQIANSPIPARILEQSPAETETELQIICLFRSEPSNILHGSLVELNEKLKGLLDEVRKPALFRGEAGETLLVKPPAGEVGAKRVLLIGLGDAQSFTPERMELIGSIAYREANRLGVAHPFFAPTVLDGGVTKFGTGEVSEQVMSGFLRAFATEKVLRDAGSSPGKAVQDVTFLAGPKYALDSKQGIERAIVSTSGK